jgi:hypothetical protein
MNRVCRSILLSCAICATATSAPPQFVPTTGSIKVISHPTGAVVQINGYSVGTTPVTIPELRLGRHQLEVIHPDHGTRLRTVNVSAGQTVTVVVAFKKGYRPPAEPPPEKRPPPKPSVRRPSVRKPRVRPKPEPQLMQADRETPDMWLSVSPTIGMPSGHMADYTYGRIGVMVQVLRTMQDGVLVGGNIGYDKISYQDSYTTGSIVPVEFVLLYPFGDMTPRAYHVGARAGFTRWSWEYDGWDSGDEVEFSYAVFFGSRKKLNSATVVRTEISWSHHGERSNSIGFCVGLELRASGR